VSVLDFLDEELASLERQHRRRVPRVVDGAQGPRIVLDGREVVSFSSNDYLGLAAHPALAAAAHAAIDRFGVGAGASRLIVGNASLHEELERAAAALLGTEAARLFNSGFAANTGLLPVLASPGTELFSDELNHASLIDGCRMTRCVTRIYKHLDLNDLARMLSESRAPRKIVVTESVFSMDGDVADLAAFRVLVDREGAILVVDEAHATGVYGEGGGVLAQVGVKADAVVSTLGKGLGTYGAVVAGSRALADVLWNRARPLVFTTGLPPAVAAAGLAAIRIVRSGEGAELRTRLWQRVSEVVAGLRELGIPARGESPIIPVVVGGDQEVMAWTRHLLERGVYVQGVRPPTVPEGTARLRIAVSAGHSEEDVGRLLEGLRSLVSRGTARAG
jgi:8-amino-7-oxononanoate synthase